MSDWQLAASIIFGMWLTYMLWMFWMLCGAIDEHREDVDEYDDTDYWGA